MVKQIDSPENNQINKIDPRTLSTLYPQAKTFEQRALDDDERQKRFMQRQPKYVRFFMAAYSSFLISILTLYILGIYSMWASGSIAAIFLSFSIAIVLVFLVIGCVVYIVDTFYKFDAPIKTYIAFEVPLCIVMLVLCWYLQDVQGLSSLMAIAVAAVIHFALLYTGLFFTIRYERA